MSDKRHWTIVTLPMRRRMRDLRAAGLSASGIAVVIKLDFGLAAEPSRTCIDAHAPREPGDAYGASRSKRNAGQVAPHLRCAA